MPVEKRKNPANCRALRICDVAVSLLPLLFKDAAKNFLIHLPRYIETIPKVILKPFV